MKLKSFFFIRETNMFGRKATKMTNESYVRNHDVDSANKPGRLLEVVQVLTALMAIITTFSRGHAGTSNIFIFSK
ncbi:hypothetical protein RND71_038651 [Anisodus tanguticus]|uniref:Uncharacterized protein n=1 Tax=Anisodus tanguticus TaxID=243964 RepID=A0AAE1UZP0_9SOLA|nr:hypothetical protein RND71_038651 [Anisodus tanguticus]